MPGLPQDVSKRVHKCSLLAVNVRLSMGSPRVSRECMTSSIIVVVGTYIAPVQWWLLKHEPQHIRLDDGQHTARTTLVLNQSILKVAGVREAETLESTIR